MDNKEILQKAIEKAVKNGFVYTPYSISDGVHQTVNEVPEILIYRHLIFSHDFAKAFWGEERADEQYDKEDKYWHDTSCCSGSGVFFEGNRWQYHLQQMVLEEEPLLYLKRFL